MFISVDAILPFSIVVGGALLASAGIYDTIKNGNRNIEPRASETLDTK
jgi:hypothetical protein